MIHLRHGPFELDLAPDVGGSVAAFRADAVNLLYNDDGERRAADDVLAMCAFPLLPFCGRIDRGRFEFAGTAVRLPASPVAAPHAIHGQAWLHPWQTEWSSNGAAALRFEHPAGDWPWYYEARQTVALDRHGLNVELELTNLDTTPMPAGLGWHPYFPRRDATLAAAVTGHWPTTASMIPHGEEALGPATDLRRPRPVAGLVLDDVFSAGRAGAELHWPDRRLTLTATQPLDFLVVYTPAGRDSFCVEPISHVPDAVNSPLPAARTGLRTLAPGQTLAAHITLAVDAAGSRS